MKYIFAIDERRKRVRVMACTMSEQELEYHYVAASMQDGEYIINVCPKNPKSRGLLDCQFDQSDLWLYDTDQEAKIAGNIALSHLKRGSK